MAVSGTAVALAGAGALLLYSGIRGPSVVDTLRSLVSAGTLPAAPAPAVVRRGAPAGALDPPAAGSGIGARFAAAAAAYAGKVRYVWGGETPQGGWDCSGFPTYVLVHDLGYTNLPSQSHTVCTEFMVWGGAQTIAGPEPGALVLWPTHMGIALDGERMVSAVNPSRGTVIDTFRNAGAVPYTPPMFRRVL